MEVRRPWTSEAPEVMVCHMQGMHGGPADVRPPWVGEASEVMVFPMQDALRSHRRQTSMDLGPRRCLGQETPACTEMWRKHEESPDQFAKRMQRVEDYMNSSSFAAPGGRGSTGLAKDLRSGCEHVIATKGRRVPK